MTFKEAARKYIEENQHLRSLNRAALALDTVMPYIGHLPLERVHNDSLAPFKKARRDAGISAATINRDLAVVRRVLNLAARVWRQPSGRTYLETAPLIMMEQRETRAAYPLEWDEQQRLLKELPEHLREMTLFMLNTGLRDQELCQLRWDWEVEVPELGETVFILPAFHSKNGEERVILLNRIARGVIERQRGRHEERVFTFKGRSVQRMLNTAWQKARIRAGLPQVRVHDLRHTVGHRLRAAGVGLEDRKAILGHTNGDITTQYSVPSLVRLRSLVELIADRERASVPRVRGAAESKNGAKVGQKASLGEARLNG